MSTDNERMKRKRSDNGASEDATKHQSSQDRQVPDDETSKRKWTRIVLRELYDLGYTRAASCLEEDANVRVRSSVMEELQGCIKQHRWDDALRFLDRDDKGSVPDREPLQTKTQDGAKEITLLLLKRKFVDQLLHQQLREALETFQLQILPSFSLSEDETQELAVLLLCNDRVHMQSLVKLPLDDGELLNRIEALVSSEEVVPAGCLQRMVQWNICDEDRTVSFAEAQVVEANCIGLLLQHSHEILDVAFAASGEMMASVGREGTVLIWTLSVDEAKSCSHNEPLHTRLTHILRFPDGSPDCISWSPDSQMLLTCGGENNNTIQLWNALTGRCIRRFHHPAETVSVVRWLPNGRHFVSGSVEKSLLLWSIDGEGGVQYQWGGRRVLDIAVHPGGEQIFVLCSETELRAYNLTDKTDRLVLRADHLIASIAISPSGDHILLNFIEHQEIACFSIAADTIISRHRGFQQERFILHPAFAGSESELVVSGSEDGSIHVWRRLDGAELCVASGHSSVVNTIAVHPKQPNIIVSASDDETLRLWRLSVVK